MFSARQARARAQAKLEEVASPANRRRVWILAVGIAVAVISSTDLQTRQVKWVQVGIMVAFTVFIRGAWPKLSKLGRWAVVLTGAYALFFSGTPAGHDTSQVAQAAMTQLDTTGQSWVARVIAALLGAVGS